MYPKDVIEEINKNLKQCKESIKVMEKVKILLHNQMHTIENLPLNNLHKTSQAIKKTWENTAEVIKQLDEKAIQAFKHYELPVHYAIDIEFIESIIDKYTNNVSKEEVNKYFAAYFDKYLLNEIQCYWVNSKLLNKRINLFQQVTSGYQFKPYGLVVSTVTTQIEGVISEKLEIDRIKNFKFKSKNLNKEFKRDTVKLKIIIEAIFCIIGFSDEITKNFYIDKIIGKHNNYNNRHSIAHGAIFDHEDSIYAIKSIVIFDAILSRLEEFETKEALEEMIHRIASNKIKK